MKRIKNLSILIVGVLSIILGLSITLLSGGLQVEAAGETADITVHSKKMQSPPSDWTQNTGNEMPEFDKYEPLQGAEFELYDATPEFYGLRAAGKTAEEAISHIQNADPAEFESRTPIQTGKTNGLGEVTFTVQKKSASNDDRDAVYLLLEKDEKITTAPTVVAFPVFEIKDGKYTDNELDTIHIYPKSLVTDLATIIVKKSGTGQNEGLNGAEFIVSKEVTGQGGKIMPVYINGANDRYYTWTDKKEEAYTFKSGNIYTAESKEINQKKHSEGRLSIVGLEKGTYQVIETKAPNGAAMIDKETNHTVNAGSGQTVEIDVKNDTIHPIKTSESNGQSVSIGQKIKYDIKSNIPLGIQDVLEDGTRRYTSYQLFDTHSSELTFVNEKSGEFAYELKDGNKVITPENYTITEGENSFILSINEDYMPKLTPGGKLNFVYFMYLNDKADLEKDYTNKVKVETGDLSKETEPVKVKTGGADFQKVDKDNNKQGLQGAEFVVLNKTQDKYAVINDQTKEVTWTENKAEATIYTSDENGKFSVTGFAYGTYYLQETKEPEGYVLSDKLIKFEVNENTSKDTHIVEIINKHKGSLPMTGGIGTIVFTVGGISAFAMAIFYFRRRLTSAK